MNIQGVVSKVKLLSLLSRLKIKPGTLKSVRIHGYQSDSLKLLDWSGSIKSGYAAKYIHTCSLLVETTDNWFMCRRPYLPLSVWILLVVLSPLKELVVWYACVFSQIKNSCINRISSWTAIIGTGKKVERFSLPLGTEEDPHTLELAAFPDNQLPACIVYSGNFTKRISSELSTLADKLRWCRAATCMPGQVAW